MENDEKTNDETTRWNKRYKEVTETLRQPEPLLVSAYDQFLAHRKPGLALDVAGGTGRHALWLMRRGWRVKLIDVSEVAIAQAQHNARANPQAAMMRSLKALTTEIVDLTTAKDLGIELYDLIVVFYYLQRELFPALIAALKPGGILVYQTFLVEQADRAVSPRNPAYLLQLGELPQAFRALRILHYREHTDGSATAELVAQK
jgi:SAM-dependent methyltransferase